MKYQINNKINDKMFKYIYFFYAFVCIQLYKLFVDVLS